MQKEKIQQQQLERTAFTPLVFSATGDASKLTTTFLKRLAACMADQSIEAYSTTMAWLRCPEKLFISHEHANFLFSVFRVVQGEAKTPKIMGCCRAIFAFLHALKIGTFRGK